MVEYRKIKKLMVQMKEEDTRGTYESMVAADAYCVHNAELPSLSPNLLELDCSNGTLTSADGTVLLGDTEVTLNYSIAVPLSSVASESDYGTAYDFIWETAGFVRSDSVGYFGYKPDDNATTSMSVAYNIDGWEYQVRGCAISNLVVSLVTKEAAWLNLTVVGTLNAALEKTAVVNTSINAITPEVVGTLTTYVTYNLYGLSALISGAVLNVTNEVIPMLSLTATKGVAYHTIVGRDARIALDTSCFYLGTDQKDDEIYEAYDTGTAITVDVSNQDGDDFITVAGTITAFEPNNSNGILHNNIVVKETGSSTGVAIKFYETPAT